MLTLNETLAQQENLEQLCTDRPLITNEPFRPNAFYGIDQIIKRFAGVSPQRKLKVVIPHGPNPNEGYIWQAEQKIPLPVVFCYPPNRARIYSESTSKRVVLSASPYLYVVEMLMGQKQPSRDGTIFFPYHSTHRVKTSTDLEGLADHLLALDDHFQPITVCIYWRDYNLGHHLPFERRKIRIVSAGHMFDPDFLYRLYHLFSMHRFAAGNRLGSHMFYGIKAGCRYFHVEGFDTTLTASEQILKSDTSSIPVGVESKLKTVFRESAGFDDHKQMEIADFYLGAAYIKSPEVLRRELLYAELLDKFGFYVRNQGSRRKLIVPTYYKRSARSAKQAMIRLVDKVSTRTTASSESREH